MPVCAVINVLASVTETANYSLNVDELRQHLGLPAVEPMVCNSPEELKKSSIQDCLRLAFNEVPAEVVREAFPMLASTRAIHPLRRLLTAIYESEISIPEFDVPRCLPHGLQPGDSGSGSDRVRCGASVVVRPACGRVPT